MEELVADADRMGRIRDFAWKAGPDLPAHVATYPSMLSSIERRMLRWLAAEHYTGRGAICDLGAFLGGSTIALAEGVRAGGHTGKVIHSYDWHRISERSWEQWEPAISRPYPESGKFLSVTRELMGDLADLVEFHSGDFSQMPPPQSEIEILFVDIAKVFATSDHIVRNFLPKLIPGQSVVIQQDYFHVWPPFDVYVMEVLHDHFEPLAFAKTSALFINVRAVDSAAVESALSRNMSIETLRGALEAAAGRWPQEQGAHVERILRSLDGLDRAPQTKRILRRTTKGGLTLAERAEKAKWRAKRRRRKALRGLRSRD